MNMARHAIIKDNKVVNVVIWDGSEWLPPRDHMVVNCPDNKCDIGDNYDPSTNTFSKQVAAK